MRLVHESASDTDVDLSTMVLKRLPAHFGLGLLFRKNIGFVFSKLIACHSLDRTRKNENFRFSLCPEK